MTNNGGPVREDVRARRFRLEHMIHDAWILRHCVKTAKSRGLLDEFRRAYRLARVGRSIAGATCIAALATFGPTMRARKPYEQRKRGG